MEPLSALSLAGTIIQFVDFGSKLFSQGCELYESSSGRLSANQELELVLSDLRALIDKVQGVIGSNEPHILGAQRQRSSFEEICHEAGKIAEDLIQRLGKLRIDGSKNRLRQTLCGLIKHAWSRREINELLQRLATLKEALNSHVLATIL